jgi:SAM-dependent methyltransferase
MKNGSSLNNSQFDEFALDYDSALEEGLSVSGEDKTYFCHGRIAWLKNCLRGLNFRPKAVLDFGCGTGSSAPYFIDLIQAESVLGVDSSSKSIELANQNYGNQYVKFMQLSRLQPVEQIDLVFCNGVFHHIPVETRLSAIRLINRSLRHGGLFALWENNPWNPGTRYVMSRIPFDRDAVTLSVLEARRLLRFGGFEIMRIDFLFVFPRVLKWLRFLEPFVSRLPLGAQYQILCRKT